MSNESFTFNFNALIQESKETLMKPKDYFASMKISGGLTEPIVKALIYGAVSGVIAFIWSILHISAAGSLFGGAIGIMILIWAIIGSIIGLFIGAVIMLVISAICKGNTDFEANARVVAAMMVLMPVSALFGFFSGINLTLGMIVSLVINIYGIYLMYHALNQALKANESTSRIVSYILAGLLVLFIILGMAGKRAGTRYMNKFKNEYSEEFKKYQEEIEKSAKELEKAAKELNN